MNLELPPQPTVLAGRWERLGAVLLDNVLLLLLFTPLMYVGGYFDRVMQAAGSGQQVEFGVVLLWSLIGFALFVAVQAYPLHQAGQTWGKRVLRIRIVDMQGHQPSLGLLLYRRYLPMQGANLVPVLGPVFGLADALFIFRGDKRCIHDLIAGTQVVVAR